MLALADLFDSLGFSDAPPHPHKALLFAQEARSLEIVATTVCARFPRVRWSRMDGRTRVADRGKVVSRFNEDPALSLLLLTTHVGGLGLTLTGADTVIFLDHDYNPFQDLQAMDRAHRIGQRARVTVYRLLARDTLEERIMSLQRFKEQVAAAVVAQPAQQSDRSGIDVLRALAPPRPPSSDMDE